MMGTPCFQHDSYRPDCSDCWHDDEEQAVEMSRPSLRDMAAKAIMADDDHIVARGEQLNWLIAQLACWPARVDPAFTTNIRFLMLSAAATLLLDASRAPSLDSEEMVEAVARAIEPHVPGSRKVMTARNISKAALAAIRSFQ